MLRLRVCFKDAAWDSSRDVVWFLVSVFCHGASDASCSLRVCVCVLMQHLCVSSFPLGFSALAILKVRDDTVGEGSVITATFPSLHLSFHVFSSLSFVARGMWTLLNFPLGGWVMETTGGAGGGESSPSLVLSSVFSSFIPSRGHWSWGLRGEKAAQAAFLLLGSVLSTLP